MSLNQVKQKTPEQQAEAIAKELIKRLGTPDIAFCFRTSSGSVYAADRYVRTVRYKTVENKLQMPSNITAFLDHKYLDPQQTDRSSDQYLPNSLVHHNGHLALFGSDKIVLIKSWNDLPEDISYELVRDNLFFIVTDMQGKKMIKKTPISFVPKIGTHPIEFCDPERHIARHRNHFGNVITDVTVTNKLPEDERRKSLATLAFLSLRK